MNPRSQNYQPGGAWTRQFACESIESSEVCVLVHMAMRMIAKMKERKKDAKTKYVNFFRRSLQQNEAQTHLRRRGGGLR